METKVSACMISYNQEGFIGQAIQCALDQKGLDAYEIVVGDDASTDKTLEVAKSMAGSEPNIRFLDSSKNLGMHGNWQRCIASCNGEYVALCEGDDFWQDQHKLKKQIDLLDANPDAAACFSNALVVDNENKISEYPYVDKDFSRLTAKDFFSLGFNPIPTCTLVFRRSFISGFPKSYFESPFADWILHTLLIQKGDYLYLPEATSSYRQHAGGVWSGVKKEKQLKNKLKALKIIKSLIPEGHQKLLRAAIENQLDQLLYFYRETGEQLKYAKTWTALKTLKR